MTRFIKRTRFLALALAVALAVQPLASMTTRTQVHAGVLVNPAPVVAPAISGSGSSHHGWFVGGLFISVASIIACAMIVGFEEDREMTLEEALLSGVIPFGCLLAMEFGNDE